MSLKAKLLLGGAAVVAIWALTSGTAFASGEESCFTSKINAARSAAGRAPLATRSDLVTIARRHSARMAASGTIFHNSNLANEAPSDWQSLGENVGMGPTCDDIHTAFMNSTHHRENILDPSFNYVGVGVVIASDGTIYVTEVFMQAASSGSTAGSGTSSGTTSPTTTSPRPRRTSTVPKPKPTAAPAPVAEPPPPPPPPPPGSKVKGKTSAYFDLLESEDFPSDATQAQYHLFTLANISERADQGDPAQRRSTFGRIASYLGGVLSGAL